MEKNHYRVERFLEVYFFGWRLDWFVLGMDKTRLYWRCGSTAFNWYEEDFCWVLCEAFLEERVVRRKNLDLGVHNINRY